MTKFALLFCFLTHTCLWAQEPPVPAAPPVEAPALQDDGVRVAVLGFHDFSETAPETAMRTRTSKFRKQMEAIRQLGITVISMDDFIAWKKGDKEVPQKSILLTFDDGWKSFYTDAYPILKELGFPFTIFLYKDYVDGGGRALTTAMIQEMVSNGASIGSHSVNHPYPIAVKNARKKGVPAYDAYLRMQMGDSKVFLESKFPVKVTSYAYPGGFYTEEMLKLGDELGYQHMFTVIPGKVTRSSPNETLPRNIILGNYDKGFEIATSFRDGASIPGDAGPGLAQTTPFPVEPQPGSIINSRLPEISADLSKVENLDPKSLVMKVAGFGEVPANFAVETGKFSWRVNRRLRQATCQVSIAWKDTAGKAPEAPLRWSFRIDLESAYLPDGE
ncbi:MAG: polysaccharide deacetylase family protein [Luteolibacter sp.]